MINNRQSGRRRGRGGSSQQQRSSGGGSGQRDSGNRIDSRARGNAAQLLEKYKNMARDAQMSGDRVNTEHYLQFADHYFRVLSDSRARNDEQRPKSANESFEEDDDYGDEGEPIRTGDQPMARDEPRGNSQSRDDSRRDTQSREYQPRDGQQREYQQRDYQQRDTQPRDNQRDSQPRDSQQRDGYARDEGRSRYQGRDQLRSYARDDQAEAPVAQAQRESVSADAPSAEAGSAERAPATRTRRRTVTPRPADNGEAPVAFDADRLPPSLGAVIATPADNAAGSDAPAEEKPKRRRGRPPAAEVQAG